MTRPAVLALGLVLLLGAGCGDRADEPNPSATLTATDQHAWVTRVVECLHQTGWDDASVTPDGSGIQLDHLPAAQRAAFTAARTACEESAGPQPNATPLTRADVEALYDQMLAARACLTELGHTSTEPPSKAQFVDDYLSGQAPWNPYSELSALDQEEWARINEVCPQPG